MRILGIDTSCDETSVALVDGNTVVSDVVVGQTSLHQPFGGVVPEIAARAHVERILPALHEVLEAGGPADAIAVTHRPGLVGPLLVGLSAAKAYAMVTGLPIVGVHHLEAHVAAAYLLDPAPEPPFLALIASGGHTLIYHVPERGRYTRLGQTIDDAAGECFDKVAALLGLPYPGGPSIEKAARDGDPRAVDLPRPLKSDPGDNFSFSGLKTAVLYRLKGQDTRRADTMNNAEGVFLQTVSGNATIRVAATNINSNGVPQFGDDTDQDFAVVCYNCALVPDFALTTTSTSLDICAPQTVELDIDVEALAGFGNVVTLTTSGVPAGASAGFGMPIR